MKVVKNKQNAVIHVAQAIWIGKVNVSLSNQKKKETITFQTESVKLRRLI